MILQKYKSQGESFWGKQKKGNLGPFFLMVELWFSTFNIILERLRIFTQWVPLEARWLMSEEHAMTTTWWREGRWAGKRHTGAGRNILEFHRTLSQIQNLPLAPLYSPPAVITDVGLAHRNFSIHLHPPFPPAPSPAPFLGPHSPPQVLSGCHFHRQTVSSPPD